MRRIFSLLIILSIVSAASSKSWTVLFGGATGMMYSPDSLDVSVGDTIIWQGDFSSHPLVTLQIPSGATPIANSFGTVFKYPITKAGKYRYWCDIHMFKGVITATGTASVISSAHQDLNYIFKQTPGIISLELKEISGDCKIEIWNVSGKKMAAYDFNAIGNLELKTDFLPAGIYVLSLSGQGRARATRKFLVN